MQMPRLVAVTSVAFGLMLAVAPRAHAEPEDAVALLPLDADKHLEIYGQPVASEIARALVAGKIDVVVVGPKMAVPERARLIIDGTITAKGDAVILAVRMRNPSDGTTLLTLSSTAPTLASIDTAAAEVSAKVLPAVRERLASFHKPVVAAPHPVAVVGVPAAVAPAPMLVSVTATGAAGEPLRAALTTEVAAWATAHHRAALATEPPKLAPKVAAATVLASGRDLAIAFEISRLSLEAGVIPMGRARVRVRIADAKAVLFDRVVVTDTVLGERNMTTEALTARLAREVLEILRPHLRRAVPTWQ
jgi:hypothetical protein